MPPRRWRRQPADPVQPGQPADLVQTAASPLSGEGQHERGAADAGGEGSRSILGAKAPSPRSLGGSQQAPGQLLDSCPDGCCLPKEFVSGGQTGADSIPFSVYEELGVALRGFMPQGFSRVDGRGRQVAARFGLSEGEGGNRWRDIKNAESADACLALLTTLPETGRGTMQTVNVFVEGKYKHVQLDKPEGSDYVVLEPRGEGKPVIVFWDISEDKLDAFVPALRGFFCKFRPLSLMLSGPMERTWPGVELLGAELLRRALGPRRTGGSFAAPSSSDAFFSDARNMEPCAEHAGEGAGIAAGAIGPSR